MLTAINTLKLRKPKKIYHNYMKSYLDFDFFYINTNFYHYKNQHNYASFFFIKYLLTEYLFLSFLRFFCTDKKLFLKKNS